MCVIPNGSYKILTHIFCFVFPDVLRILELRRGRTTQYVSKLSPPPPRRYQAAAWIPGGELVFVNDRQRAAAVLAPDVRAHHGTAPAARLRADGAGLGPRRWRQVGVRSTLYRQQRTHNHNMHILYFSSLMHALSNIHLPFTIAATDRTTNDGC